MELQSKTNLKIYTNKVNGSGCEITLLLSSANSTLCWLVLKQRFTRNFSVSEKQLPKNGQYEHRNSDCKSVYLLSFTLRNNKLALMEILFELKLL